MSNQPPIHILFVCLGNICRSPLAEGVFRDMVQAQGLEEWIRIDSAGTGSWHIGERPDKRMRMTADRKGISLEGIKARQFKPDDFEKYDHILVMDRDNLHDVLYLDAQDTFNGKVQLFREFDPEPGNYQVPDPYYGGEKGFENVFEIVKRTSRNLLDRLIETYDLSVQST